MADFRVKQAQAKLRNVPIAVTPEGFWCCPSPAVLQKTMRTEINRSKHKITPPVHLKAQSFRRTEMPSESNTLRARVAAEDQRCINSNTDASSPTNACERPPKLNVENPRKISVGFGQPETSDLKVILYGKEGIAVRMNVHRNIVAEHSSFFADLLSRQTAVPYVEIAECEDVEIYVETVGLMYCKEVKHRLIKQTVPRVLRILKVSESLGFRVCVKSCLDYLEAVPWFEEEEETVISSVRHLKIQNYGVSPLLKRVASGTSDPPSNTLAHILELVLKSNEDRGRREMKSMVLKLLKENSLWSGVSSDQCTETLYSSCESCLESLLDLFRQASQPGFSDNSTEITRQIALEADNILWLLDIMSDRHSADEFAEMWAGQSELAELHSKLPTMSRHLVSCITCRLFVGIGKGEILPSKDTRHLLLQVWLQPLIDDYNWLQHGCRTFDRKSVEEGIGRTILTLPLEDQQTILLSWMGSFLKVGDNCPNLHRAFEVWWRRTFIKPYSEQDARSHRSNN